MRYMKHYQLAAAGLAILGAALIADHNALRADAADIMKYAGTTAPQEFDGSQGYFAPHRACAAKIPTAVWCTTEMTRNFGPHPTAEDPPEKGAWIQAAPQGMSNRTTQGIDSYVDAIHGVQDTFAINCSSWTGGDGGIIIKTEPTFLGPRVVTESVRCGFEDSFRPAACCSTRPLQVFFPATPGPPIRPKPGE